MLSNYYATICLQLAQAVGSELWQPRSVLGDQPKCYLPRHRLPCCRAEVTMSAKTSGRHRERRLRQLHCNFNNIGVRTFILYGAPLISFAFRRLFCSKSPPSILLHFDSCLCFVRLDPLAALGCRSDALTLGALDVKLRGLRGLVPRESQEANTLAEKIWATPAVTAADVLLRAERHVPREWGYGLPRRSCRTL
jgi:hypothetical protein